MMQTVSYFREALREPLNIGGLLLAGVAGLGAATVGVVEPALVLGGAAILEGLYLATVPGSATYRRIVDRRSRQLTDSRRREQRLELIRSFEPREREAVEYLSWMKGQIANNYRKFTGINDETPRMQELETAWEAFVDLLDEYRRRKSHLRRLDRQGVVNQLRQAERTVQLADPTTRSLHEKNVDLLQRRLQTFDDIERSVKRVEAQLQMIENFFGLVNDQVITMPVPESHLSNDFDSLLTSIETTREILQQTAPVMGQLDQLSREASQHRMPTG
jgi:hypothetical protein